MAAHRRTSDSVWVEPFDFINEAGATLLYVPSLQWLYASVSLPPVELARLNALITRRGWNVTRVGNPLNLAGVERPAR